MHIIRTPTHAIRLHVCVKFGAQQLPNNFRLNGVDSVFDMLMLLAAHVNDVHTHTETTHMDINVNGIISNSWEIYEKGDWDIRTLLAYIYWLIVINYINK